MQIVFEIFNRQDLNQAETGLNNGLRLKWWHWRKEKKLRYWALYLQHNEHHQAKEKVFKQFIINSDNNDNSGTYLIVLYWNYNLMKLHHTLCE